MIRSHGAFTLIELLIVVAIIAVLAAIAVPNFLEAQTRAKISRLKNDMRAVGTGIEAYRIDNSLPPITGTYPTREGFQRNIRTEGKDEREFLLRRLDTNIAYGPGFLMTTPVSYLSAIPIDIFNTLAFKKHQPHGFSYGTVVEASFYYMGNEREKPFLMGPASQKLYAGKRFRWMLQSCGPDLYFWGSSGHSEGIYDPTNGTTSKGDIWYTSFSGPIPR